VRHASPLLNITISDINDIDLLVGATRLL